MTKIYNLIYNEYYNWLCDKIDINPCAIIYLQVDPKISYQNMHKIKNDIQKLCLDHKLSYNEKTFFNYCMYIFVNNLYKILWKYLGMLFF